MLNVKSGDWRSFTLLVDKHRSPVEHFLYNKLRDRALAEELTQEVFLRVYRARCTYQPTGRFKTWLFQIASRVASNARRDGRKERMHERLDHRPANLPPLQIADLRPSIEQEMVHQVKLKEVRRAVAILPEKQKTGVLMHKFAGMEYAEIARVFNCSESAVKSLMFRAYETLRSELAHLAPA